MGVQGDLIPVLMRYLTITYFLTEQYLPTLISLTLGVVVAKLENKHLRGFVATRLVANDTDYRDCGVFIIVAATHLLVNN